MSRLVRCVGVTFVHNFTIDHYQCACDYKVSIAIYIIEHFHGVTEFTLIKEGGGIRLSIDTDG